MTPVVAHRLLNAPTPVWISYQKENPDWGHAIASFLRAGTLSPLAVTNNLRKLTDCMADPEIQPQLCDWFSTNFVPRTSPDRDKSTRVQEGLAKCVRSIQLQAIAQGHSVNILAKTDTLTALAGDPLDHSSLLHSWILSEEDIYTMGTARKQDYFTNGKRLGSKSDLQKVLCQYQKMVVDSVVANPFLAKDFKDHFHITLMGHVGKETMHMAHAALWEDAYLNTVHKQALALHWRRDDSVWSTREQDRLLDPQKTAQWDAWAVHAQTYLDICNPGILEFYDTVKLLETCPPLQDPKELFADLNGGVFSDTSGVVS